jgi:uracil-DNA glycosylase
LTTGIDVDVYAASNRDWRDPVIGLGPHDAPLCIFGRDPGRAEVERGLPFVGRGGQLLRAALHGHVAGMHAETPTFEQALSAGANVFWLNTVPYKPIGNKAWSSAVKERFQPLIADLLLNVWLGSIVLAVGREVFLWFGIGQAPHVTDALKMFWKREDRYEATLMIDYVHVGRCRTLILAPLPHPSPANAVWRARLPALLAARLVALTPVIE